LNHSHHVHNVFKVPFNSPVIADIVAGLCRATLTDVSSLIWGSYSQPLHFSLVSLVSDSSLFGSLARDIHNIACCSIKAAVIPPQSYSTYYLMISAANDRQKAQIGNGTVCYIGDKSELLRVIIYSSCWHMHDDDLGLVWNLRPLFFAFRFRPSGRFLKPETLFCLTRGFIPLFVICYISVRDTSSWVCVIDHFVPLR